jgi:hypothetical protein
VVSDTPRQVRIARALIERPLTAPALAELEERVADVRREPAGARRLSPSP